MALTAADVQAIVDAIRATPNGVLFKERSHGAVWAVSIVDGTKRHISRGQSAVMNAAGIRPLTVDDGALGAFTSVE